MRTSEVACTGDWDRYQAQRGSALEDAVAAALNAGDDYDGTIS